MTDKEIKDTYPAVGYNYSAEGEMPSTEQMINEAVARKLGWTQIQKKMRNGHPSDQIEGVRPPSEGPRCPMFTDIPDYCHSIEAAWEIVEHLHKEMKGSFRWDFVLERSDRAWRCGVFDVEDIEADTAPMAICLAFLQLSEIKVESQA